MGQVRARRARGDDPAEPGQGEAGRQRGTNEQRRLPPSEVLKVAHQAAEVIGAQRVRQDLQLGRAALYGARDPVLMPFQLLAGAMHCSGQVVQLLRQALFLGLCRGRDAILQLLVRRAPPRACASWATSRAWPTACAPACLACAAACCAASPAAWALDKADPTGFVPDLSLTFIPASQSSRARQRCLCSAVAVGDGNCRQGPGRECKLAAPGLDAYPTAPHLRLIRTYPVRLPLEP